MLDQVRIVLVEPTHPGNIGSVARAMKTMGLHRLVLVNPKKFPHYEASKLAAGAESVLDSARVVSRLDEAIGDCDMVVGTSVRDREVKWPTVSPRELAVKVKDRALQSRPNCSNAAILFGRESSGLTNQELDRCDIQVRIDANPEYSSLNLASAVQILAYELRMSSLDKHSDCVRGASMTGAERRQEPASKELKEGHLQHLFSALQALDFVKSQSSDVLMRKLTRLYNKAELTVEEIQILRGILSAIESNLGAKD